MGIASDLCDPANWTKRLYGWRFVIARHEGGTPAIEFRMERCGTKYVVEERSCGTDSAVWYVGPAGIVRTHGLHRPPRFNTRNAASNATSKYYRLQYGESKCQTALLSAQ